MKMNYDSVKYVIIRIGIRDALVEPTYIKSNAIYLQSTL